MGLVIMREMARHRLNRVHFVGMPRSSVEAAMRGGGGGAVLGVVRSTEPHLDRFHGWQVHRHVAVGAA